ncbi:MAG: Thymidine kinase [Firmicutes bacterium ADurb.Bin182]|nr:MAG: Thymidine kinase [Firmicutes bacterium ADurb.Bin182]
MAKLYFRYGAMGSSKTANALMVKYNYGERGQNALLVKPGIDMRDGMHVIKSRCGLSDECVLFANMDIEKIKAHEYDCIIVDEAQFLTKQEVELLTVIVDEYEIPVICYGLRADFQGNFFEGSHYLMAWADTIEEVKTICWCGRKAIFNARLDGKGGITKVGEQVVLGANDKYIGLCRKHWRIGDPGPLYRKAT